MRILACTLLLASLASVGPAWGQAKTSKPYVPAPARVVAPPPPARKATPPLGPPRLGISSLGMSGLPGVGDRGPACRAQCSQARYVCTSGGDSESCDGAWLTCLSACSAR